MQRRVPTTDLIVTRLRVMQSEFARAGRKGRARHVQDVIDALEVESITEALTRGMQQTRLNLERVMKRLFPLL